MKPTVLCLMLSSIDGRLHPSRFTKSPDGDPKSWEEAYETLHDRLKGDAWMVGRTTMAEMSKAEPHAPVQIPAVERPVHVAADAKSYAVAIDRSGKLHFDGGTVGGDRVIVLLGRDVSDSHLAELAADGVSYIVAESDHMDLANMLDLLDDRFGISRLLLEGGGEINGAVFAAGLVDELHVIITPTLDAGADVQGIVAYGEGLRGKVELTLRNVDALEHGAVHLAYAVLPTAPAGPK